MPTLQLIPEPIPPDFGDILDTDSPIAPSERACGLLQEERVEESEWRINQWLHFALRPVTTPWGKVYLETDLVVKYPPAWENPFTLEPFDHSDQAVKDFDVKADVNVREQIFDLFPPKSMEIVEGWEADYQAVGAGNAGTVLKGKFNATGRKVAIKISNRDPLNIHKLVWEAEVAKALQGRPVGPVMHYLGFARSDQPIFGYHDHLVLVMDLLGPSLWDVINEQGTLTAATACHFGFRLLSCVEELHSAGWLHRSMKPQNVCLTPDGRDLRLIDFGGCFRLSDCKGGNAFKLIVAHIVRPLRWSHPEWNDDDPRFSKWWDSVFKHLPPSVGKFLEASVRIQQTGLPPYSLLKGLMKSAVEEDGGPILTVMLEGQESRIQKDVEVEYEPKTPVMNDFEEDDLL